MAFREEEIQQWEPVVRNFVIDNKPPEEVRDQVDLDYRMENQSFIIFELRPHFLVTDKMVEIPVAKFTWIRIRQIWKLYWQRADLKWHKYIMADEVDRLEDVLKEIDEDPWCCFWG